MAAVGILAAVIERERSGEGQLVDVSMTDGSLAWLSMVIARYFAEQKVPHRGDPELTGGIACYFPFETKDGKWVSLGALEPKFWQNWCAGVGRPDLVEKQFVHPASESGEEIIVLGKRATVTEYWTGLFEGPPGTYRVKARAAIGEGEIQSEEHAFTLKAAAEEKKNPV